MLQGKDGSTRSPNWCLNPFEVREVLQVGCHRQRSALRSLNPFEVREVLQGDIFKVWQSGKSLNPFEVREVLQAGDERGSLDACCLNPFEVREVLQARVRGMRQRTHVSIPLKSGRCCKTYWRKLYTLANRLNPFEVREVLQAQSVSTGSWPQASQSL